MGDLTMEIVGQGTGRGKATSHPCSRSSSSSDNYSAQSVASAPPLTATTSPVSLSSQLHAAITADKALYHRILLFEPVSFDEISSTAKRAGVTGLKSKETLRSWLDKQGICFYSAELTGQRQRY